LMGRRSPLGCVMLLALQWATNQPWSPDMWISSIVSAKSRTSVALYCSAKRCSISARPEKTPNGVTSIPSSQKTAAAAYASLAVDCVYGIAVCGGEHFPHLLVAHLFCLITCRLRVYRLHRSEQQKHRHRAYHPHTPPQPRRIVCEHQLLPFNNVALALRLRHFKSSLTRHWRPSQRWELPRAVESTPGPARGAQVRAHHALTAAGTGLTPKIFSTRVKL